MKSILVDDELWLMRLFEEECSGISDIQIVGKFSNAADALEYAESNRVDLAFLDIEMPKMNGLDLSEKLRDLYPDMIVIFVSAYDQHMRPAMKDYNADWFLLKPYTAEEVQDVLERAKLLSARQRKKVEIKTFGNFEVYADGKALKIQSTKAKELLALLVDRRGDSVSVEEGFSEMWPEIAYDHTEAGRYRTALKKLQNVLVQAGIENIVAYFPHARAILCDAVKCDYFDLMNEDADAIRAYQGRYMEQYAWADGRVGLLNEIKLRFDPDAENTLYLL